MIAFSCAHCGMKFQVKPEFAGRSTRCPTCKQPLVVPPEATVATPAPSRIDGPLSSLARAGVAADVTVGWQRSTDKDDAARPVAEVLARRNAEGQRYLLEGEIARGGMGAVLRAVDCDIRRELGNIDAIEPRSDVYSLGAVLYEMLTLQPPVDKSGGMNAILLRVIRGEIVPPEQRTAEGARKIPPELSAVAVKALSKDKKDRYPTVEALRRDIERYLEGRSVSAREDTRREMLWKLVKRNKGFSAGVAMTLLVLLCSLMLIGKAYLATKSAYAAYQREQSEKDKRTRQAVPAFLEAARLAVERHRFGNAVEQVNLALDYDPDHAEARLLKGQLLIVGNDFAAAAAELEHYLRQQPKDTEAQRLLALCRRDKAAEVSNLLKIAQLFEQQHSLALADSLLSRHGRGSFEARKKLLQLYRKRIESAWPGLGDRLSLDDAGIYRLDLNGCRQVTVLDALEGMPLTWLNLSSCGQVRDLSPLKGMPLNGINLQSCVQVRDLSPLKGMLLRSLALGSCGQIRDLSPLKGMPLTTLDLNGCGQVGDLSPLKGMPLTRLSMVLCGQVHDLTPLKGMPLTWLRLDGCDQLHDLSPLEKLPLTEIFALPAQVDRGMDVLRSIKTLGRINSMEAEDFWKKYDAGKFPQYKR